MTIPSDHCYVSDPYSRISTEGQLKAAASGKYGLIGRLLPVRARAGTPSSTFSKVLEHGALTLRDLEGIIAAAQGRLH